MDYDYPEDVPKTSHCGCHFKMFSQKLKKNMQKLTF